MTLLQPSSSAALSRNANRQRPLPSGYVSIRDILEGTVSIGRLVSVIGLVKDRRVPIPTNNNDWKSSLTLYDKSVEDEDVGLTINIFRPESEMPQPDAGDVVVVISAKLQSYRGELSLITNWSTAIHVYSASQIPKPPKSALPALGPPLRQKDRLPADKEHEYVAWLYHSIDKDAIPDVETFNIKLDQSRNVKQKFCLLKDVEEGQFCDIIVNVVKDPYDEMERASLWVTDYTENEHFYKFSWDSTEVSEGRDGDPYGYTTTKMGVSSNWAGPYGKRSIQVTCFGVHAEQALKEVKFGSWVRLRNLQIKFGRNGSNLEGFLREDRSASGPGVQIDILATDDPDNVDSRFKEAIRRKRTYEKDKKKQQKNFAANEGGQGNGGKRKAEGPPEGKTTSKQRRNEKRAMEKKEKKAMEMKKIQEKEEENLAKLGLNDLVKCENPDQPIFAVSFIVDPIPWQTTVNGQEAKITLPFTCAKYRANVRVVDYRPRKLEDFAAWRKSVEYDLLSDCSGVSDSESDEDRGTLDRYAGEKIWEWQFALQLEEANPKHKGENNRVWVVVDNIEAQLLVNIDALDLRANPDDLNNLREQLFKLWGNLEECKEQDLQHKQAVQKRFAANKPPPSSPIGPANNQQAQGANDDDNSKQSKLSNKPFTCCIQQYGVKIPEENPRKANAGEGMRWERVFGLFGTKICS
ncbi:hypothetical protein GGR54DRAFT_596672 [Hypoxylon sp. NC1633]|nr:hypothetical protein GGR54DRAFT_596672 [Hypoxylon sp. NC1633]